MVICPRCFRTELCWWKERKGKAGALGPFLELSPGFRDWRQWAHAQRRRARSRHVFPDLSLYLCDSTTMFKRSLIRFHADAEHERCFESVPPLATLARRFRHPSHSSMVEYPH